MTSRFNQLVARWIVLALGVMIAAALVPGIDFDGFGTLVVVAVLLSLLNSVLKPLLVLFAFPFIVATLGLGMVVINAFLFLLAGRLVQGFHVAGFFSALGGGLVVSATNMAAGLFVNRRPPGPPPPPWSGPPPRPGPPPGKGDVIDI
jgi:putative membrane protein